MATEVLVFEEENVVIDKEEGSTDACSPATASASLDEVSSDDEIHVGGWKQVAGRLAAVFQQCAADPDFLCEHEFDARLRAEHSMFVPSLKNEAGVRQARESDDRIQMHNGSSTHECSAAPASSFSDGLSSDDGLHVRGWKQVGGRLAHVFQQCATDSDFFCDDEFGTRFCAGASMVSPRLDKEFQVPQVIGNKDLVKMLEESYTDGCSTASGSFSLGELSSDDDDCNEVWSADEPDFLSETELDERLRTGPSMVPSSGNREIRVPASTGKNDWQRIFEAYGAFGAQSGAWLH
jgi:hypothetical protein